DLASATGEGERRAGIGQREAVVKTAVAEIRVEPITRLLFTRRYPALVEPEPAHRRQREPPLGARQIANAEIRVATETDRYPTVRAGGESRFQSQAVWAEHHRQFEAMAEWEHGEEITPIPFQLRRQSIGRRCGHLPYQLGPRHSVHRQPVRIEVEQGRRWIE